MPRQWFAMFLIDPAEGTGSAKLFCRGGSSYQLLDAGPRLSCGQLCVFTFECHGETKYRCYDMLGCVNLSTVKIVMR